MNEKEMKLLEAVMPKWFERLPREEDAEDAEEAMALDREDGLVLRARVVVEDGEEPPF